MTRKKIESDDWYDVATPRRLSPRSRIRATTVKHPYVVLLITSAVLAGIASWESVRIADAQATVPQGWLTGLVAGVAASVALMAAGYPAMKMARRAPTVTWTWGLVLVVAVIVAFRGTTPDSTTFGPYVITTGIGVAGMAFTATFTVECILLCVRAAVWRLRGGGKA